MVYLPADMMSILKGATHTLSLKSAGENRDGDHIHTLYVPEKGRQAKVNITYGRVTTKTFTWRL